jgi:hypothetical protein
LAYSNSGAKCVCLVWEVIWYLLDKGRVDIFLKKTVLYSEGIRVWVALKAQSI